MMQLTDENGQARGDLLPFLNAMVLFPNCTRSGASYLQVFAIEYSSFCDCVESEKEYRPSELYSMMYERIMMKASAMNVASLVSLYLTMPLANGKPRNFNNARVAAESKLRNSPLKNSRIEFTDPLTQKPRFTAGPASKKEMIKAIKEKERVLPIMAAVSIVGDRNEQTIHSFRPGSQEYRNRLLRTIAGVEDDMRANPSLQKYDFYPVSSSIPNSIKELKPYTLSEKAIEHLTDISVFGGFNLPQWTE